MSPRAKHKPHRFSTRTGALIGKAGPKVRVPREFGTPGVYAITGDGDCMTPVIEDGDTVICDPSRQPKGFDLVAIYLRNGRALIKRLRHFPDKTGPDLFCETDNPERMFRIPGADVVRVHVITYNATQDKSLIDLPYPREFIVIPCIGTVS